MSYYDLQFILLSTWDVIDDDDAIMRRCYDDNLFQVSGSSGVMEQSNEQSHLNGVSCSSRNGMEKAVLSWLYE